jgi:hypothetical protein
MTYVDETAVLTRNLPVKTVEMQVETEVTGIRVRHLRWQESSKCGPAKAKKAIILELKCNESEKFRNDAASTELVFIAAVSTEDRRGVCLQQCMAHYSLTIPPTYLSNAHKLTRSLMMPFSSQIEGCSVDLTCTT